MPKNWMNFAKKHELLTAVSAIVASSLVLVASGMFFVQDGVTAVTPTTPTAATITVTITTTDTMAGLAKTVNINGSSTTVAAPVQTETATATATPSPTTTAPVPTQTPTPTPTLTPTPTATSTPAVTATPNLVAAQTISPTSLVATQTGSPTIPVNQETDQKVKDLEAQVKQLKEQQAQQERKISWLESLMNSLWKIFGFIFGWTAPLEPVANVTSTPTAVATSTSTPPVVTTSTPVATSTQDMLITPIPTTTTPEIVTTVTPTETPTPTPDNVLFYDDFSGGFPGKNWIYTGGGGTPQVDSSTGNPGPSLWLPGPKLVPAPTSMGEGGPTIVGSGQGSLIELRSATNPFNTVAGFEISADVSTDTKSSFTFSIINQNEKRIYASAMPTNGYVTYEIRQAYNTGRSTKNPVMADSDFHKLTFKVDANGNAKWLRDDVQQFSLSGFPAGDYIILFKTSGGTTYDKQLATRGVYIDNVKATSLMQTASPKETSTSSTTTAGRGTTTSTIGTLSVSDDNGNLYVGGSYIGRGSAVVSLYAGSYTLSDYSPSTGDLCWQRSIRIDGGKTTLVKIDTYCR